MYLLLSSTSLCEFLPVFPESIGNNGLCKSSQGFKEVEKRKY